MSNTSKRFALRYLCVCKRMKNMFYLYKKKRMEPMDNKCIIKGMIGIVMVHVIGEVKEM